MSYYNQQQPPEGVPPQQQPPVGVPPLQGHPSNQIFVNSDFVSIYYIQQQPPVGVPPQQGYPPDGYSKDAYPVPVMVPVCPPQGRGYLEEGRGGYPAGFPPLEGHMRIVYPPDGRPVYDSYGTGGYPAGFPRRQGYPQQQQSSSTGMLEGCLAA